MQRFQMTFEHEGTEKTVVLPPHWGGPHSVKGGFWVNDDLEVGDVHANDSIWVPPHKVQYIKIINVEEERNGSKKESEEEDE